MKIGKLYDSAHKYAMFTFETPIFGTEHKFVTRIPIEPDLISARHIPHKPEPLSK